MSKHDRPCQHAPDQRAEPQASACQACGSGTNLRMCATCGYVGCCDSQAGHNRLHALRVDHPVIYSLPLDGRSFVWCYAEQQYVTPHG